METLDELERFTTVFIAVDKLDTRRKIQQKCNELGVSHISVGIGLDIEGENDDEIGGMVKIETRHKAFADMTTDASDKNPGKEDVANIYGNIQTAELNMLGAALAIAEWKASKRIYRNERESGIESVIYSVSTGRILQK